MLISGKSAPTAITEMTKNLNRFLFISLFKGDQKVKRSNKLTLCISRHVGLLPWILDFLVFGWEECVRQHNIINIVHPRVIQQIWVKVEKHRHLHLEVKKKYIKTITILRCWMVNKITIISIIIYQRTCDF